MLKTILEGGGGKNPRLNYQAGGSDSDETISHGGVFFSEPSPGGELIQSAHSIEIKDNLESV